jgi:hypothetical protein
MFEFENFLSEFEKEMYKIFDVFKSWKLDNMLDKDKVKGIILTHITATVYEAFISIVTDEKLENLDKVLSLAHIKNITIRYLKENELYLLLDLQDCFGIINSTISKLEGL